MAQGSGKGMKRATYEAPPSSTSAEGGGNNTTVTPHRTKPKRAK